MLPDPILQLALERRSDLVQRNEEANRLVAAGDAAGAERLYLEILDSAPRHYEALYNLGLLYNRGARFVDAAGVLERAVDARPRSADAHFLLAMTHLSLEQPARAMERLRRALELDPEHALARDLMQRLTGDG